MKFLTDENVPLEIARRLQEAGHQVRLMRQVQLGAPDPRVIDLASDMEIILTQDKDFADHVFRDHHAVLGVVLLRLDRLPPQSQARRTMQVVGEQAELLIGRMTVVFPAQIRQRDVP